MRRTALAILLAVLMLCGVGCFRLEWNTGAKDADATPAQTAATEATEPAAENPVAEQPTEAPSEPVTETSTELPTEVPTETPSATPTPEPTATPTPTPTPTPKPTATPKPTPRMTYRVPQEFKPTTAIKKDLGLPVVYNMHERNPKNKKEAQMFTFDLNMDGKAEKISFKLDTKKHTTTITAGSKSIKLDEGDDLVEVMLIDLDPSTQNKDLVVSLNTESDKSVTIVLHVQNGKLVRATTLKDVVLDLDSNGILQRLEDTQLLGSRSGWRSCSGEDLTPDDEWLDVNVPDAEELETEMEDMLVWGEVLKLKRELPCRIDGEAATLPSGTILYLTRFHQSGTLAEVRTTDGVTAVLEFTLDASGWPYRIAGISQEEYFENELSFAE